MHCRCFRISRQNSRLFCDTRVKTILLNCHPAKPSLLPAASPSPGCVTVRGPAVNKQCVFPFEFRGVTYNECTFELNEFWEPDPWCSTSTDHIGDHVGERGNWGFCSTDCKIAPPPPETGTRLASKTCVLSYKMLC